MSQLSLDRVLKMTLGGAAGGYLTFLILDPSIRAEERSLMQVPQEIDMSRFFLEGAVIGAVIGVALVLAGELPTRNVLRLVHGIVFGAILGGLIGAAGSAAANIAFGAFTVLGLLIVGRALGWGLMGAAAGICPGAIDRSLQRVRQGVMGGMIGGAAGGVLFDPLSFLMGNGSVSRAVGFVLMGAAIGAAVSLIEEFGKAYWLTALTGSREGRSFILAKSETLLGRDELTDIPLFGDPSVGKRHARLVQTGDAVVVMAEPGAAVTVNNQPVGNCALADGDIVGFGRHRFRFSSRHAPQGVPTLMPEMGRGPVTMPPGMAPYPPPVATSAPTKLEVIAGPHSGSVFPITPGAIVGRDPRCDIPLTLDTRASRQHARLVPEGASWRIEDGGSTNGLFVNGQQVYNQVLQRGDQIGVGDSVLRVG